MSATIRGNRSKDASGVSLRGRMRLWWQDRPVRRKLALVAAVALVVSLPPVALAVVLEVRLADLRTASETTRGHLNDLRRLEDLSLDAGAAVLFSNIERYGDEPIPAELLSEAPGEPEPASVDLAVSGSVPVAAHASGQPEGEDYEATYREAMRQITALLERLRQGLPREFDDQMQEIADALGRQAEASDPVILEEPPPLSPELLDLWTEGNLAVLAVREAIDVLEEELARRLAEQRQDVAGLETLVTRMVLASWIITFVAIMGATALLATDIVRRTERLMDYGRQILRREPLPEMPQSKDELGQLIGGVTVLTGLLDERRKEAEAATHAANQFLSRISQELRGPLTGIMRSAEVLDERDLSPDNRRVTAHIVKGGEHLLTLIDDLLDISEIETGHLSITTQPVALDTAVDDAIALVQERARQRAVSVATSGLNDLAVAADPQRLRQALLNLLTNAIKYNRPAGRVDITADRNDGMVRIKVTDTGLGISREGQQRLFRPFERLGVAPAGTEGNGIGLALTKNLVEAMGGAIGVDSEPGEGSTFWIDLHAVAPSGAGAQQLPGAQDLPLVSPQREVPAAAAGSPVVTAAEDTHDAGQVGDEGSHLLHAGGTTGELFRLPPRRPLQPWGRRLRLWWRDLAIRRKVVVGAVLALAVSVPMVATAVVLELRLSDARDASQETQDQVDDVRSLLNASLGAGASLMLYSFAGFVDDAYVEEYQQNRTRAGDLLDRLEELPAEFDEEVEQVLSAFEPRFPLMDRLMAGEGAGGGQFEMLMTSAVLSEEVRAATGVLAASLDERLAEQRHDVTNLESMVTWTVVASWAITFLAVVGFAGLLVTDIVNRLEGLAENGVRFLQGKVLLPLSQSRDELGELVSAVATVGGLLDKRRRAADAATHSKNEFLSRISHELKTPLTSVIGFGEILEDEELPPDEHEIARGIVEGGNHLLSLVDDLLDLSKLETGHLSVTAEPVRLDEVVNEAVRQADPQARDRGITITTQVGDGLTVAADPDRLRQVVGNLLSNAITHNGSPGSVHVTAEGLEGTVRLGVRDTGPGLEQEDLDRIFEPFVELATDKPTTWASGVRLALTKGLVEAMGGAIGVESERGRGSLFRMDLPVPLPVLQTDPGSEAAGEVEDLLAAAAAPVGVEQPTVLYSEHDLEAGDCMEQIFRERGERLQITPDGDAAFSTALLLHAPLVFVSSSLPDMDGDAILEQLKTHPDTAPVPVVMVATDPTPDQVDRWLDQGADTVLARPVSDVEVHRLVDEVLGARR